MEDEKLQTNAHIDNNKADCISSHHIDFYSERLKFLWEQYIKIIQLVLILSGVTIVTIINTTMTIMNKGQITLEAPHLAILAIIITVLSGMLALGWRFSAQILMERQIYGERKIAVKYFEITETSVPWALRINKSSYRKLEITLELLKYTSGPLLLISWILLVIFFYRNIT